MERGGEGGGARRHGVQRCGRWVTVGETVTMTVETAGTLTGLVSVGKGRYTYGDTHAWASEGGGTRGV